MEDTRGWILAERETEDGLSLIRIKQLESTFDFRSYPERMTVIWDFQDTGPKGTPSRSESNAMEIFENRICENIESENRSVLSIVFTEPGYRQWEFYCRDVGSFIEAINEIPQEADPYPIEIQHESDESGEFYKSYARHLVKT